MRKNDTEWGLICLICRSEELIAILERFGRFEFRQETRVEELAAELFMHICAYPWLDGPVLSPTILSSQDSHNPSNLPNYQNIQ